ncbi:hypothetical protein XOC_0716 [Xanthomonas oryzae pv. oryzicola BLS256]|uniref:Uncharacterized protein n=1 Tax=Xanthomonas oryzae pv. oryzicola (strain BLS256) TaxID=383407 RepID=G7TCD8_XANOB|nr:hypothetical protein XOC_0716 [Xanthomonas oryzae pv. oryzicola BLS256]
MLRRCGQCSRYIHISLQTLERGGPTIHTRRNGQQSEVAPAKFTKHTKPTDVGVCCSL